MNFTINILLTSATCVFRVDTQGLSAKGIFQATKVAFSSLQLPTEQRNEQEQYLSVAAKAAFSSLNELDKSFNYRAIVKLSSNTGTAISFTPQSNSSGLAYAIALGLEWRKQRQKKHSVEETVFATGHIHPSGAVTSVGHILSKVTGACNIAQREHLSHFVIYYPESNKSDVSTDLVDKVELLNGRLIAIKSVHEAFIDLLGDDYDGLSLGRWEPFKGLDRFTYADRFSFFGREIETNKVVSAIDRSEGVIVVTGPSGSGKSSLLDAGVRPILEKSGDLTYQRTTSAEVPFAILTDWCAANLGISKEVLTFNKGVSLELGQTTLWVFDQVEDMFVSTPKEECESWFDFLCALASNVANLNIIFCLRHEYSYKLKELEYFVSNAYREVNLNSRLKPAQWKDIIYKQAKYFGLEFEKGLVDSIRNEAIRGGDSLPLVELLLTELYQHSPNSTLTLEAYRALGGLTGVIQQYAEHTLLEIPVNVIEDGINLVFSSLIEVPNVDSTSLPILKYVDVGSLESKSAIQIIEKLYKARLVVLHPDKPEHYKFVHDVLIKDWSRITNWLDEYRPFLYWRQTVDSQFQQWLVSPKHDKYQFVLGKGKPIEDALYWRNKNKTGLSESINDYIEASKDKVIIDKRKRTLVYGGFLVFSLCLSALLFLNNKDLNQQRQQTQIEFVNSEKNLQQANHYLGLIFFEKAVNENTKKNFNQEYLYRLQAQLLLNNPSHEFHENKRQLQQSIEKRIKPIWSSVKDELNTNLLSGKAISPKSDLIALGAENGNIDIYDLASNENIYQFSGHTANVSSVAFSPDETILISGDEKGLFNIWDFKSRQLLRSSYIEGGEIEHLVMSNDGNTFAIVSDNGDIGVWDTDTQTKIRTIRTQARYIRNISISVDSNLVSALVEDKVVKTWNVKTGVEMKLDALPDSNIESIAFTPDKTGLAMGLSDGRILIRDVYSGDITHSIQAGSSNIYGLSFSQNGEELATGDQSNIIKIWNWRDEVLKSSIVSNHWNVIDIQFGNNSNTLFSRSGKGTKYFWDIVHQQEKFIDGRHYWDISDADFSPDLNTVTSNSWDGTTKIWDARTGKLKKSYTSTNSSKIIYSGSHGTYLVESVHESEFLKLNNSITGQTIAKVPIVSNQSYVLDYENDIVALSEEGVLALWDIETQTKTRTKIEYGNSSENDYYPSNSNLIIPTGQHVIIKDTYQKYSVWDTKNSVKMFEFESDEYAVSQDGNLLAALVGEKQLKIWDVFTGRVQVDKRVERQRSYDYIAFDPAGNLFVNECDTTNRCSLRILDPMTGILIREFEAIVNSIVASAFHPNGVTFATSDLNGGILIWENMKEEYIQRLAHTQSVETITFSHDGNSFLAGDKDNIIRVYDFSSYSADSVNTELKTTSSKIGSFNKDGDIFVSTDETDNRVLFFDTVSQKQYKELTWSGFWEEYFNETVTNYSDFLKILKRKTFKDENAVGTKDESIDIKKPKKHSLQQQFLKKLGVQFSESGNLTSIVTPFAVQVLNSSSGAPVFSLINDIWEAKSASFDADDLFDQLYFSPDANAFVLTYPSGLIDIYDNTTFKKVRRLDIHNERIVSLIFGPSDNQIISSSMDGTTKISNIKTGEISLDLDSPGQTLHLHSDNELLTIIDFSSAKTFEITKGATTLKNYLVLANYDYCKAPPPPSLCIPLISTCPVSPPGNYCKVVEFNSTNNMLAVIGEEKLTFRKIDVEPTFFQKQELHQRIEEYNKTMSLPSDSFFDRVNKNINPIMKDYLVIWPKTHPFRWMTMAENNAPHAMVHLGNIAFRAGNYSEAKKWFSKAQLLDYPEATKRLLVITKACEFEGLQSC